MYKKLSFKKGEHVEGKLKLGKAAKEEYKSFAQALGNKARKSSTGTKRKDMQSYKYTNHKKSAEKMQVHRWMGETTSRGMAWKRPRHRSVFPGKICSQTSV